MLKKSDEKKINSRLRCFSWVVFFLLMCKEVGEREREGGKEGEVGKETLSWESSG